MKLMKAFRWLNLARETGYTLTASHSHQQTKLQKIDITIFLVANESLWCTR
jgi:hypothetical protein